MKIQVLWNRLWSDPKGVYKAFILESQTTLSRLTGRRAKNKSFKHHYISTHYGQRDRKKISVKKTFLAQ